MEATVYSNAFHALHNVHHVIKLCQLNATLVNNITLFNII